MRPAVRRSLERFHHFEDMEGEAAARPVRALAADGMGHVGHPHDAVVAVGVGMLGRHLLPVLARRGDFDVAAEPVGVGHGERRFGPVDLDRPMAMARHVEAHHQGDHRAGMEFERPGRVGGHLHRDARSLQRLAGDQAFAPRARGDAGDALDRAEQVDEIGDVVGAHVEHRAAAGGIVERRARMPALMSRAHEERRAGDRRADRALVDQLAAGLVGAAEKRIGRAADAHALRLRRSDELAALGDGDAERLLRMDVLARGHRLEPDLDMRLGDGEIDDDLDRRVGQEIVDALRRNAEFGAARLGSRRVHVGDGAYVEDREDRRRLEIGRTDIAATDDADPDAIHVFSCSFNAAAPARSSPTARRRGRGASSPPHRAPRCRRPIDGRRSPRHRRGSAA